MNWEDRDGQLWGTSRDGFYKGTIIHGADGIELFLYCEGEGGFREDTVRIGDLISFDKAKETAEDVLPVLRKAKRSVI